MTGTGKDRYYLNRGRENRLPLEWNYKEMEMIKREKELLRRLRDLEKDLQEGKISESKYRMLKREYQRELEAMEAAERRLQVLQVTFFVTKDSFSISV